MTRSPADLRIAPTLTLPIDAVTQTFAVLGKRGSGKTTTAVVLTEELLAAGQPTRRAAVAAPTGTASLTRMQRAMLSALAQHPEGLTKKQILVHTGYASSGPVSTAFADLTREGWVEVSGGRRGLGITDAGLRALGPYDPLPVGDALRAWLLAGDKLSTMEKALLGAVCAVYPKDITKGQVLERTGYASSGPVSSAFAKLVAYNYLIPQGPSRVKAAEELFS